MVYVEWMIEVSMEWIVLKIFNLRLRLGWLRLVGRVVNLVEL